jgi:hypothetical protein
MVRYERGGASAPAGTRLARPADGHQPDDRPQLSCESNADRRSKIVSEFMTVSNANPRGFGSLCEASSLLWFAPAVKVRITDAPKGQIDGVDVDLFHQGLTYEMPSAIAMVLICDGCAEPVDGILNASRESEPRWALHTPAIYRPRRS